MRKGNDEIGPGVLEAPRSRRVLSLDQNRIESTGNGKRMTRGTA